MTFYEFESAACLNSTQFHILWQILLKFYIDYHQTIKFRLHFIKFKHIVFNKFINLRTESMKLFPKKTVGFIIFFLFIVTTYSINTLQKSLAIKGTFHL